MDAPVALFLILCLAALALMCLVLFRAINETAKAVRREREALGRQVGGLIPLLDGLLGVYTKVRQAISLDGK